MGQSLILGSLLRNDRGFTIVELSVVIIALAILAALTVSSTVSYQSQSRDNERAADIDVISRALERSYRTQAVSIGPTYPASTVGAAGLATIVNEDDATKAPDQTSNSIVIATTNAEQTPTINQYIYQPLNIDGSLCTSAPCVRYTLYYLLEKTNTVIRKDSMRQQ